MPLAFRVEHGTEQADETQSKSASDISPTLLVDQHEICARFQGNSERLRLTRVEIGLQASDQSSVGWRPNLDPVRHDDMSPTKLEIHRRRNRNRMGTRAAVSRDG